MAKILLSFSSTVFHNQAFRIVCFYEGLIQTLAEEGNEVLVVNAADFLHQSWNAVSNDLPVYFNKSKIVQQVKDFSPELVITFNHAIPTEIEEACECPIVLWDADSIPYWNGKEYVKKHLDKYIFFACSNESIDCALEFGANKKNVFMLRGATAIKAEKKDCSQNISFIGTNFTVEESFIQRLKTENIQELKKSADSLVGKFYDTACDPFTDKNEYLKCLTLVSLTSTQNRITVLNNVVDLGLSIWGTAGWIDIGRYLPWLAMCYNKESIYALKHNQDIYNSSKLCISIAHAQATQGFPWRIMDIMASNGCLVSDYKSGISDFTKGYVEIPMYKSTYDARKLCKKLLADDIWREEIVLNSQRCIEEKGRWQHRFREIEQIFGLQLLKNNQQSASLSEMVCQLQRTENIQKSNHFILAKGLRLIVKLVPSRILRFCYRHFQKIFNIRIDSHFIAEIKGRNIEQPKNF